MGQGEREREGERDSERESVSFKDQQPHYLIIKKKAWEVKVP